MDTSAECAGARVLIVDDSATMRAWLAARLRAAPLLAEVQEATNGAVGARMALEQEVDVVLCNLRMPFLDGIGFLRVVRQSRSRLELPVLLVTASTSVPDKVTGFHAGASDYLTTPCEPEELVARVSVHATVARLHRAMVTQAHTDPLTGLANRRALQLAFEREAVRAVRHGTPLGMVLVDLDHFKHINDTLGHPAGDAVLRDLARMLRGACRAYDIVARMGGEEFALLLPESDLQGALEVGERVRSTVMSRRLGELDAGKVTLSAGVAAWTPGGAPPAWDTLYGLADAGVYTAKSTGRNRVARAVVPSPPPPPEGAATGIHAVPPAPLPATAQVAADPAA
ncbi:MAG: diguanylate cyclase [Deltaproteobacteria bacterium]|nr:diguanylate cyclase [Deltaproteobacteria bacterium]